MSMSPRFRALWLRAPLLILLLAWFAIGLGMAGVSWIWRSLFPDTWPAFLANVGFDVWGVGFLALIAFGFYMRVRNVRFRI